MALKRHIKIKLPPQQMTIISFYMKTYFETGKNPTYLQASQALRINRALVMVQLKAMAKKGFVVITPRKKGGILYTSIAIRCVTGKAPTRLKSRFGVKEAFGGMTFIHPQKTNSKEISNELQRTLNCREYSMTRSSTDTSASI